MPPSADGPAQKLAPLTLLSNLVRSRQRMQYHHTAMYLPLAIVYAVSLSRSEFVLDTPMQRVRHMTDRGRM